MIQSPLKWAGSKKYLAPKMRSLYASHSNRRWVDLFCGSCALPLALQPTEALLGDRNHHLVNFWRWVRDDGIATVPFENDRIAYYAARESFNTGTLERNVEAQTFYYLNKTNFRGLVRYNANGGFNVPYGAYKSINYLQDFSEYRAIVTGYKFKHQDFAATINFDVQPDDWIYADPPYDGTFNGYTKESFDFEDQQYLVQLLAKHPGPVVASNANSDRIVKLYESHGFNIEFVTAPRAISSSGDRSSVLEMLATKNL